MPDHKRILVIEDDPDYQRLLAAVFTTCAASFEPTLVPTLQSALTALEAFTPDLILVDLQLPDSTGYATFQQLRARAGAVPIVILTGLDDDQLAVQAVEDGAQDYLVKSLVQPKLVLRCLQMALTRQLRQTSPAEPAAPTAVLSFIGSKGGVGTSVTAVNVAAVLSQFGHDTVVLEFASGIGTSGLYGNQAPPSGLQALLAQPVAEVTAAGLRRCLAEVAPGLHVSRPGDTAGLGRIADADQAQALISAARQIRPHVVLDLPPRLDPGVAVALRLSDSLVLVVDRERASVDCAAALLAQIRAVTSPGREVRLVLVDRSLPAASVPVAEIGSRLQLHPLVIVPAAAEDLAAAFAARAPLVFLCPGGEFSRAHVEVAERLLGSGSGLAGADRWLHRKAEAPVIPEMAYS